MRGKGVINQVLRSTAKGKVQKRSKSDTQKHTEKQIGKQKCSEEDEMEDSQPHVTFSQFDRRNIEMEIANMASEFMKTCKHSAGSTEEQPILNYTKEIFGGYGRISVTLSLDLRKLKTKDSEVIYSFQDNMCFIKIEIRHNDKLPTGWEDRKN